jgi:hypothetical protein
MVLAIAKFWPPCPQLFKTSSLLSILDGMVFHFNVQGHMADVIFVSDCRDVTE